MNEQDRLRVLIPHWIEHNEEHAAEFSRWAKQAGPAEAEIMHAAGALAEVNNHLLAALEILGGSLEAHYHHHLGEV
jgi:hypothetical protein